MKRQRTELTTFTHNHLEEMAKIAAKGRIVGDLFIGEFHSQECEWRGNVLEVRTTYTQGSWEGYNK